MSAEYIEREAAIDTVGKWLFSVFGMKETDRAATVFKKLRSIPSAEVRPVVRGKWIDRDDDYHGWNMWACSACGEEFVLTEGTPDMNDYHFCPNCGADMREELNE